MQATITTPAGKLRTQTSCRYVLLRWTRNVETGETTPPVIVRRSDSLQTMYTIRRRKAGRRGDVFGIFDTTTGEQQS